MIASRAESGDRPLPVWSMVLRIGSVIGLLAVALLLLSSLAGGLEAADRRALWLRILGGAGLSALALGLIALLSRRVEHRRLAEVGLGGLPASTRAFAIGAAAWVLPAAAAFGVLAVLGAPIAVATPPMGFWATLALLVPAVLLSEALPEEVVFRGYVTRVLGERLHGWRVIFAQAALFTLTAVLLRSGASLVDLSLFAAMGIGLGYLRMITGSVWTAIGFHTAFQTASQLLLTHGGMGSDGPPVAAMLALGAVPFAVGTIIVAVVASTRPSWFGAGRVSQR